MKRLEGKWALVTGSTRGIGRLVAKGLAQHGCSIIIHGRTEEACKKCEEEIRDLGVETFFVAAELGKGGEEKIIQEIQSKNIPVDILYNNAGIAGVWKEESFSIPISDWEAVFAVNLFAMVRLCNAFVPGMIKRGWGRVVNVTSGIKDVPQLAPYGASKAALDKYTQDLAFELKETGVLANRLDPGWLKTDLGGKDADFAPETVLPGALLPVLLDERGDSGRLFLAQDLRGWD